MKSWLKDHGWDACTIVLGLVIAVVLRFSLLDFKSVDYFNYTKEWYNTLKSEGFAAFGRQFSNYNLPYLYLLYLVVRFLPQVPSYIAVKIPSMAADFISAFLVFRIIQTGFKSLIVPFLASFCLLVAPTVVLNSALWGQADAVYVCTLLGCLYFLLQRRDNLAMALFGLALAFKAQSLFLAPVLGGLILRREIRWRTLIWIPAVFLASLIPAWAAGRPPVDLLLIYPSQAAQYQRLTLHAPSSLAWIPDTGRYFPYFNSAGLILAALAALAIIWAIYRSRAKLAPGLLIELALISAILIPFCLPRMHERYFFLADVLSIAVAFLVPALFFAPVVMLTVSFFAYQPTLFGAEPVSMGLLALALFLLLVSLVRHVAPLLFYPTQGAAESRTK